MSSRDVINIIIVEDDQLYRDVLLDYITLNESVNCCASFANVADTLHYLEENKNIDVIILDIGLPGIDGISAISKIKSLSPESKIIMLTIFDDEVRIFESLKKGANGYLLKSDSEEKIIDSIKEVYYGGGILNPSVANTVINYFNKVKHRDYNLTKREIEVLKLLSKGKRKKEIAEVCHISYETVVSHVKNIFCKLHVNNGVEAVAKALNENLI